MLCAQNVRMEETLSQILLLGPSSYFMLFRTLFLQHLLNILRFLSYRNQDINKKSKTKFPTNGFEE